jgi:Zn-dependent peptidase ImmA (M78 family)
MAGLHANRGAKRARETRAALGLDPAAPIPCLLTAVEERAGLPVLVAALPDGLAGVCVRDDDRTVLWVNGTQVRARQRFTLAHELGHARCGHDGRMPVETIATLNGGTTSPYEVEANAFAAELLVPAFAFERLGVAEPTLEEVAVIAAHYGVSATMVVIRFGQLGLASERRLARLRAEVAARLHEDVLARLGLGPLDDRLARIAHLPYLSPALAGSRLEAARRGEAAVDASLAGAIDRLLGGERRPAAVRRPARR